MKNVLRLLGAVLAVAIGVGQHCARFLGVRQRRAGLVREV